MEYAYTMRTMERTVDLEAQTEDIALDTSLRPSKLGDFIGQEQLKESLGVFIEAAKKRGEPLDHVLFFGPPGLGKTTLAHIIAAEMGVQIRVTSGPALERIGDVAAILTNLGSHDILFVDEIHRMNRTIEEVLYPAMEDCALDLIVGKGPGARTLRMQLQPFTLIGATTKMNLISSPLRDRFGAQFHLDFYTDTDIGKILTRSSRIMDIKIDAPSVGMIASRSRRTPRVANRLLKRVRDFAEVQGNGIVAPELAQMALDKLNVDKCGLDTVDRIILEAIIHKFGGGPVGLNTLAASIAEEMETLETIYEPFLLQMGFIERTSRGRCATRHAYEHLGITAKSQTLQKNLL